MASDISRERFDARAHYTGVLLQQGRVLLDADFNELGAILDRRLRANAVDLGSEGPRPGIAGVAVVPRTTPDAFRIELDDGGMTIGLGRMYVDGLLAENHGDPADGFDPLLEDRVGSEPVAHDEQPHWPTPEPLPESGQHLVYLDVWEREVTALEDPDLVEPALGVDTTSRLQTVWQVRLHDLEGTQISCATPDDAIPGWADVIAPSGGRLSTGTVPVDDDDDPCELPPTGGYRGPENQTYRVEVHDPGEPGEASFKWSRDNGSVASRVVEVVSPTRLRPARLGRDGVLRLRTGDWVEVLDDHRELGQRPGELRRITVHEEDGTISFDTDLPGDLVLDPAEAAARNLRVRRWDQTGTVRTVDDDVVVELDLPTADGTVPVPGDGAAVVLEHGITVRLTTPDDGRFRTGDHWVFVARTADTSVEELDEAPPLGPHHHVARLAVVDLPGTATSCRVLWPPESGEVVEPDTCGGCTVCVTPVSHATGAMTVQQAVDEVAGTGGTVCLAAGRYVLDEPITVTGRRSVTITGQGPSTLLLSAGTAFEVNRSVATTIEDLAVVSGGAGPIVHLGTTVAATVQRVLLVAAGAFAGALTDVLTGEEVDRTGTEAIAAEMNVPASAARLHGGGFAAPAISLGTIALRPHLRDNVLVAPAGIIAGPRLSSPLMTAAMELTGNVIVSQVLGIGMLGPVVHLGTNTVADNTVLRTRFGGIALTGAVSPGGAVRVSGNTVATRAAGIGVGPSGFDVVGNVVHGDDAPAEGTGAGIVVMPTQLPDVTGATTIADNEVREVPGVGVHIRAAVEDLTIRGNVVARAAGGIVMDGEAGGEVVRVLHNTVRDIGVRGFDQDGVSTVGIQVLGAARVDVTGNTVQRVATDGGGAGATGIRVLGTVDGRVQGNSVTGVGTQAAAVGIHVGRSFGHVLVSGNTAHQDGEGGSPRWTGLLLGDGLGPEDGADERRFVEASDGERAWVLTDRAAIAIDVGRSSAIVDTNDLTGGGRAPAAALTVRGDLTVSANHFRQRTDGAVAALVATAATASVQGNRAVGGQQSIVLQLADDRVAVVGNIVRGAITVAGAPLQAPWSDLNPEGI